MATGLEDERGDELWFELPGGDGGDLGVLRLSGPHGGVTRHTAPAV